MLQKILHNYFYLEMLLKKKTHPKLNPEFNEVKQSKLPTLNFSTIRRVLLSNAF